MMSFSVFSDSLSENTIAFGATFSDGSSGIYLATLEISFVLGDMDIDEDIDFDDIDDFVLALSFPAEYEALRGVSPSVYGDTNGDGDFDFDDIAEFVAVLNGSVSATRAVPEPSSLLLTLVGILAFTVHSRARAIHWSPRPLRWP